MNLLTYKVVNFQSFNNAIKKQNQLLHPKTKVLALPKKKERDNIIPLLVLLIQISKKTCLEKHSSLKPQRLMQKYHKKYENEKT